MENNMKSKKYSIVISVGIGFALLIGLTTGIGVYVGNRLAQDRQMAQLPPLDLMAGTAARTKSLSMATGLIDNNVEALFVLDHLTGNLQCWLLNTKTGNVGGIYRASAATDLAVAGKSGTPEYIMTTGNFFFRGGSSGNAKPANSICYIGDANTGNVVGYSLTYNEQALNRGGAVNGALKLICKGAARTAIVTRDQ
ncbi:hypothetical protein N9A77_00875 [bacterium]|nr:hypothetical protein [bacterium]